jgi:DtxR family Mn-dependent transcriptional regulator
VTAAAHRTREEERAAPAVRGASHPLRSGLGAAAEDYLKAIYEITGQTSRVAPSSVAAKLGVSQAAVTKMVKRLRALKLVRYTRTRGVELTDSGRLVALETIRHHRLIEMYLHQALGYSWDEVDREAEILEHVISEDFEDRIDRLLGHPTHDPHGSPIPTKDGRIEEIPLPSLADLAASQAGTVRRVFGRDPEMLRYLNGLGIALGTEVKLLERAPFGGPLRVRVGTSEHVIGVELARAVFVDASESAS